MTMDATALYYNIPNSEGLDSLDEALEERQNPKVPAHLKKML